MTLESIIVFLIVGAVAGWLAGQIVKGHGCGLVGNIVVGIVGAFLAGWLLPTLGFAIGGGIIAAIINALINPTANPVPKSFEAVTKPQDVLNAVGPILGPEQ